VKRDRLCDLPCNALAGTHAPTGNWPSALVRRDPNRNVGRPGRPTPRSAGLVTDAVVLDQASDLAVPQSSSTVESGLRWRQ
jgi:hypothetical protein